MRNRISSVVTVLVIVLCGCVPVLAQEYIVDEKPIPESVDQEVTPMELSYQEKPSVP